MCKLTRAEKGATDLLRIHRQHEREVFVFADTAFAAVFAAGADGEAVVVVEVVEAVAPGVDQVIRL